jgi:hypothetical protein
MALPKIKQNGKRIFVLCDSKGTAKTISETRQKAEAWFCLLFHMIMLDRSDVTKMRSYMRKVAWTVREVEVVFKPTGVIYPVAKAKRKRK